MELYEYDYSKALESNALERDDYSNTLEWDDNDYRVMHWNIIIRYGNKFEFCDWNNALK